MITLDNLEQKLQKIRVMLDEVAEGLSKSDIPCRTADIIHIGEALAAISEVQLSIYEQCPDLRPEYLNDLNKDRDLNQELGRILIQSERYLSGNSPNEAIQLFKEFKSKHPPKEYIDMADNEINRIKSTFSV